MDNNTLLANVEDITSADDIIKLIKYVDAINEYCSNNGCSFFDPKILNYFNIKKKNIDILIKKYKNIINDYLISISDIINTVIISDDTINSFYHIRYYIDNEIHYKSNNTTELLIFVINILKIKHIINDKYIINICECINQFDVGHLQLLDIIIDKLINLDFYGDCFYLDSDYKFKDDIENLISFGSNTILYQLYINNFVNLDYIMSKMNINKSKHILLSLVKTNNKYYKDYYGKNDTLLALFFKYNDILYIYLYLQYKIAIICQCNIHHIVDFIFKINNSEINKLYTNNIICAIKYQSDYDNFIKLYIKYFDEEIINTIFNENLYNIYNFTTDDLKSIILNNVIFRYNNNIITPDILKILHENEIITIDKYIQLYLQICDADTYEYDTIRIFYFSTKNDAIKNDIIKYIETIVDKHFIGLLSNNSNEHVNINILNFINLFNNINFSKHVIIKLLTYYSIYYNFSDDYSFIYNNCGLYTYFYDIMRIVVYQYNTIKTIPIYTETGDMDNVLYNGNKVLEFLNTYTEYKWEIIDNFLIKNEK